MSSGDSRAIPAVAVGAREEPHELHVLSPERCSFPACWRFVNDICVRAFEVFDKKPEDIVSAYNELNIQLSEAHAIVYRLTAFPCMECPALVRGSSFTKVVGDKPESTQVLVVYYLLREMLKKQMQQRKNFDTSSEVIISNYLDAYEKLSGGVNLVKCAFTYMHWVWEKLGLPTEHVVLPTESIATHLWTDIVVNDVKEKLTAQVTEVVKRVRTGSHLDFTTVENVKRLSLNLATFNDGRQTYYTSIIESPYHSELTSFYTHNKLAFKRKGPERYIYLCLKAVAKEEFLAKCLLARGSFEKIRAQLIAILITTETEYLKRAAMIWLRNEEESKQRIFRASLFGLYELLGGGVKATWMEELLTSYVAEAAQREMLSYKGASDSETPTRFLRSVKTTHHTLSTMLMDVFGNKPLLFSAMLAGLKQTVNQLCDDPQMSTFNASTVAAGLVKIASDEITSEQSCSTAQGNWVADIYGLLEKKDVFHFNYEKLLEIRLLRSACFPFSEAQCVERFNREEAMLRDLFQPGKTFDFVSVCHCMLKDVYITSCECRGLVREPVPLNPLVLTKFMWGGLTSPTTEELSVVPAAMRDLVFAFNRKYCEHRLGNGKVLNFLPYYSTAVVRMKGSFGGFLVEERIVVSCGQLSILLLFNKAASWSVPAIEAELGVATKLAQEAVTPLVASKILLVNASTQSLSLNPEYRPSPTKYSILVPEFHFGAGKERVVADYSQHRYTSGQEYLLACQSCIVKMLKERRELALEDIHVGVTDALAKYHVSRKEVKEALEKLIERGFVGRDADNKNFVFIP